MPRCLSVGPLLIFALVATATGQTDARQDTLAAGTPEFELLQQKIEGRERVRVTTQWGRVVLYGPELAAEGMGFGRAQFEKRPPRGTGGFRRPLPLSEISRIDVRVGTAWAGALIGAGGGILLTTAGYGLCDEDCESSSGTKVSVYVVMTAVTALVGAMIGRDGWGWSPVYRSESRRSADLHVSGDQVRLTIRLPFGAPRARGAPGPISLPHPEGTAPAR